MTLQEAQKQIAIKYKLGTTLVTGHKATYFNEASELYASSREEAATTYEREQALKWIKPQDKLPEINQFVLADYGYKIPLIVCYKGENNWLAVDSEAWLTDEIKYWMLLPETIKLNQNQ